MRDLKHEHDTLIARLENSEERQIYKTAQRRKQEEAKYDRWAKEDAAEEKWRIENGLKTEAEEYVDYLEDLKAAGYQKAPPWEQAEAHMEATELERRRHLPPTAEEIEEKRSLINDLPGSGDAPITQEFFNGIGTVLRSATPNLSHRFQGLARSVALLHK